MDPDGQIFTEGQNHPNTQCCGSGSARIRIIFPDPADPDRYKCHAYETVDKIYFKKKFSMSCPKYLKLRHL
jgi:hypothetical protein